MHQDAERRSVGLLVKRGIRWKLVSQVVVQVTRAKYHEAFERLTTIPFPAYLDDPAVVLG